MSIHPDMEKWKQRFFLCLVLALGTLFLTGAREVTHDINRRPARIEKVDAELREWGRAIVGEEPGSPVSSDIAAEHALFLVRTCTYTEDAPGK